MPCAEIILNGGTTPFRFYYIDSEGYVFPLHHYLLAQSMFHHQKLEKPTMYSHPHCLRNIYPYNPICPIKALTLLSAACHVLVALDLKVTVPIVKSPDRCMPVIGRYITHQGIIVEMSIGMYNAVYGQKQSRMYWSM